jgi:hypothetical protein
VVGCRESGGNGPPGPASLNLPRDEELPAGGRRQKESTMNLGQIADVVRKNNAIAERHIKRHEDRIAECEKHIEKMVGLYKLVDDRGEISKRGQGVFEDIFKVVAEFTITELGQSVEGTFLAASDYHFDALKWTACPTQWTPRWGVRIRDLSSEVELSNNGIPIPGECLFGDGELPFVEVGPRRFVARGGIQLTIVDNGTIDGITKATDNDYPYCIKIVIHGKKVFLQRVAREGQ